MYKAFRRRRVSDGKSRNFSVGNFVTVRSEEGGSKRWIAHLVGLFAPLDVEDGSVDSMLCTLRWMYAVDDLEDGLDGGPGPLDNPSIPQPVKDEVFFSDHVDVGDNEVDIIFSRVIMCTNANSFFATRADPPKVYQPGDAIRLCRCFYASNRNPQPLRNLERKELRHLSANPSEDTDLFEGVHLGQLSRRAGGAGGIERARA